MFIALADYESLRNLGNVIHCRFAALQQNEIGCRKLFHSLIVSIKRQQKRQNKFRRVSYIVISSFRKVCVHVVILAYDVKDPVSFRYEMSSQIKRDIVLSYWTFAIGNKDALHFY